MKIVIPDDFPPVYPDHGNQLDRLRQIGEVEVHNSRAESEEELIERLQDATFTINVRAYSKFTDQLLKALPKLRLISVLGTGTDNIDLVACDRQGVVVTNCPTASTTAVAELTMGLFLSVARHLASADQQVRQGIWSHAPSFELRGKVLGIIGLGRIGQEVARLGQAFGMRVIAWSFHNDLERADRLGIEQVPFDDLLREADVISLHLRNSSEAQGLIGENQLVLMKPTAVLINTARAAIVDELALINALKERRIAGAGIDVFLQEPLPPESEWAKLDNVVLTPHIGAATLEAQLNLAATPVDNILNYVAGRSTNVVNFPALQHPRHQ